MNQAVPDQIQATFTLSFDCEGKWGMADNLTPGLSAQLTNAALKDVYRQLLALLAQYDLPATFAFVAAHTLSPAEYQAHPELLPPLTGPAQQWLNPIQQTLDRGEVDGWLNPEALALVATAGRHEIASHSHRHIPGDRLDEAQFAAELARANEVAALKGVRWETFIYPRNQICYPELLRPAGILAYRGRPAYGHSRPLNLLHEFNLWAGGETMSAASPLVLPAGHFLNWRAGPRRLVPTAVTVRRWRNMLARAMTHGQSVHLWSHPHNFLTGRRQFELLVRILDLVAAARATGRLRPLTQRELALKATN
ncbi:MAG: polysaccharide deacetylase family protein [Anaerolineales bacterium]|nr:polysaccharide deacetylase family protein [Anaerolineales bacterium]